MVTHSPLVTKLCAGPVKFAPRQVKFYDKWKIYFKQKVYFFTIDKLYIILMPFYLYFDVQ